MTIIFYQSSKSFFHNRLKMISDKLYALSDGTFQVLETLNGSTYLSQGSVTTSWDRRELWSQWSTTILSQTPGPRFRTCTSPGTRLPWPTSTTSSSSSVGALLRRSLGQVISPLTFRLFFILLENLARILLGLSWDMVVGKWLPHGQVVLGSMPIATYLFMWSLHHCVFSLGLLAKRIEGLCQFKKLHKPKVNVSRHRPISRNFDEPVGPQSKVESKSWMKQKVLRIWF